MTDMARPTEPIHDPAGAADAASSGPPRDPRVGTKLGKYQILGVLGKGGMGVVYEAEDPIIGRRVAVKLLPPAMAADPTALRRFLSEAKAAGKLNHPNAVRVFDVDQDGGHYYLVMELVPGGSVGERLRGHGPYAWREATRIIADICRALTAAHGAGLIHRDIKPVNILRTGDGAVKLADFGLAKNAAGGDSSSGGGNSSGMVGTPAYMSPEQCQADPLDGRSDLYSLGMTYYTLLTGRPPYEGGAAQVMMAQCSRPTPDPRQYRADIPAGVIAVLERATAKNREDRFPNAGAMLVALEAVLAEADRPAPAEELAKAQARIRITSTQTMRTLAPPPPGHGSGSVGRGVAASGGAATFKVRSWQVFAATFAVVGLIIGLVLFLKARREPPGPAPKTPPKSGIKRPADDPGAG